MNVKRALCISFVIISMVFFSACQRGKKTHRDIQIVSKEDSKQLLIDGRIKAFVDTTTWESKLQYTAVMSLPPYFFSTPGKALLIGLGGGSIAKDYRKRGWSLDVVEPDSAMLDIAGQSLGFLPDDAVIHRIDGQEFLASHTDTYDIILVDAISTSDSPGRFMTQEFFELAGRHLNPGGIVALSLECVGWHDPIVDAICATLKQRFPEVLVLPIVEPPNIFGSIVIMASNIMQEDVVHELERNDNLEPMWRFGAQYHRAHAWDNHFTPDTKGVEAQTDSRNTIEELLERNNEAAKKTPEAYIP